MSPSHLAFSSCCSPTIAIEMSSSLDTDGVIGKPGLELQRVYADADARKILKNFQDLRSLDLVEEIQNSPELTSLACSFLEKAANFNGSFCSSEKLAAEIEGLLAVMAQLGKEESALDDRLKSVKEWRRCWISAFTAVIIALLVVSPVLACVWMPHKVIYSTVVVSGIFKTLQSWLDSLWDEREKELERTRDAAKTMRRFACWEKDELVNIQFTLAPKTLCEDLGTVRVQMDDDGLGMVEEEMAEEVEKDMRGKVKACAAGVEKSAVEFLKYITEA